MADHCEEQLERSVVEILFLAYFFVIFTYSFPSASVLNDCLQDADGNLDELEASLTSPIIATPPPLNRPGVSKRWQNGYFSRNGPLQNPSPSGPLSLPR